MLHIHPNARTTPATRAEIARSSEPSGIVAQRYGISAETVRKWRKRGASDCLDRSAVGFRGGGPRSCDQGCNKGAEQGLAASARVVHELEKAEVMRWTRPVGQFGGLVKLGPGCCQAASFTMPIPFAP